MYQYNEVHRKGKILYSTDKLLDKGWEKIDETFSEAVREAEKNSGLVAHLLIFVFSSSFIDYPNGSVRKPYIDIFKSIVKRLNLVNVLGYLSIKEIVAFMLQDMEFIAPSGYVVEIDSTILTLYSYLHKEMQFVGSTAKTDNIGDDIISILSESKNNHLASSIYVISQETDESYIKILSFIKWPSHIFVQPPKIYTLSKNMLLSSMNKVVEQNLGILENKPKQEELLVTKTGFLINNDIKLASSIHKRSFNINKKVIQNSLFFFFKKIFTQKFKIQLGSNFIIPALLFFVGLFLFGILTLFFHTAEVQLFYKPYKVEEKIALKVTEDTPKKENEIYVRNKTSFFTVSGKITTTGSQERGEKAKGNIILHNWENQPINLAKGEKIIMGPSNLVFELDSDIQVPGSKEVSIGTKETGKAKGTVTAFSIGSEYNLNKDTKGTVSNRSINSIFAVAESNFSGGTKKTIKTISKKDYDTMYLQATNSALIEFKKKQNNAIKNNILYVDELFRTDLIISTPSGEIGEEASSLEYKADVKIIEAFLNTTDLKTLGIKALSKKIKNHEQIDEKTLIFVKEKYSIENKLIEIIFSAKTSFLIDKDTLTREISGMNIHDAQTHIVKRYPMLAVKILINPDFVPYFSKKIPLNKKSIFVKTIN